MKQINYTDKIIIVKEIFPIRACLFHRILIIYFLLRRLTNSLEDDNTNQ